MDFNFPDEGPRGQRQSNPEGRCPRAVEVVLRGHPPVCSPRRWSFSAANSGPLLHTRPAQCACRFPTDKEAGCVSRCTHVQQPMPAQISLATDGLGSDFKDPEAKADRAEPGSVRALGHPAIGRRGMACRRRDNSPPPPPGTLSGVMHGPNAVGVMRPLFRNTNTRPKRNYFGPSCALE